jgi:hypothetical protein
LVACVGWRCKRNSSLLKEDRRCLIEYALVIG